MKTLSPQNEQVLLDAVRDARRFVTDGDHPTAAVVKTAKARDLSPHFADLVCYALNTGGVQRQQETGVDVLDKMASMPLADADEVRRQLYPTAADEHQIKRAEAVDPVYSQPVAKRASTTPGLAPRVATMHVQLPAESDGTGQFKALVRDINQTQRKVAECRTEVTALRDKLANAMVNVKTYFRKFAYDRLPWAEVRNNTQISIGPAASRALEWVDAGLEMTKAASSGRDATILCDIMDLNQEPYASLNACEQLTRKLAEAEQDYLVAQKAASLAQTKYDTLVSHSVSPPAPAPEPVLDVLGNHRKSASALEFAMGTALGQRLNDVVAPAKPPSQMMEGHVDDLGDPRIEGDIRKAKVQSMLTDYLANDEVISGYDPQEVTSAYNELAQISPRASDNPGIMRSMLRQRLAQGQLAPFDIEQLTGIERSLQQSRRSSGGVLENDSSRILG